MRPAAKVAKCAKSFQSSISIKFNERIADAKSLMAILILCATFGSVMDIEASGADEEQALAAITAVFQAEQSDSPDGWNEFDDNIV